MSTIFRLRTVASGEPSRNLDEARVKLMAFFRRACRAIPEIMETYNLYDIVTTAELRSSINSQIRKNSHIKDPQVIDLLLFKGDEELLNIIDHSKQRHHIIGQYVVGIEGNLPPHITGSNRNASPFMQKFFDNNHF